MKNKSLLRSDLLKKRDAITPENRLAMGQKALKLLLDSEYISKTSIVSAYWPVRGEFDVRPIIDWLHDHNIACALPFLVNPKKPLVFHRYKHGNPLEKDSIFQINQPGKNTPVIVPDIILAPMLGFDRRGYRLGMGGGLYDRTLAKFKTPYTAIGVGFADSELPEMPAESYDIKMQAILTEKEFIRIAP